jgi:replication-associated recombination protein RarA
MGSVIELARNQLQHAFDTMSANVRNLSVEEAFFVPPGGLEKDTLAQIIKRRLALEGEELAAVLGNPKYKRLFENAAKESRYRLVAEVVASKGCHSGQKPQ